MGVGSDKGSDSDFFKDVRDDVVLDADGPDAAEEASNDGTAEGDPAEEAPMKLPKKPSDPTPEKREKHNKTHVPHRVVRDLHERTWARRQALHSDQ